MASDAAHSTLLAKPTAHAALVVVAYSTLPDYAHAHILTLVVEDTLSSNPTTSHAYSRLLLGLLYFTTLVVGAEQKKRRQRVTHACTHRLHEAGEIPHHVLVCQLTLEGGRYVLDAPPSALKSDLTQLDWILFYPTVIA